MRWTLIVTAIVVALATGCASDGKKEKTGKEIVKAQWNHTRALVLFGLGKDQYSSGNFDAARKSVNEAESLDPENEAVRVLSAKLAIEAGNLDLADKELEKARKINPKDAEADYLAGVVQQRWQQPQRAYDCYTAASDKSPDELAYLLARSEMLVAMSRQEEALKILQDKVVYFEHSAVIRDAVGQLLMQFARYKEAANILDEASVLATDDLTITEHLAFANFMAGQFKQAIDPFQKLIKNEKYQNRADLWLALGQCQMESNRAKEAKVSLEKAVQIDNQNSSGWLALARLSMQQGELTRAEGSLKRAIAIDASRSEARLLMGYLKLRQNRLDDALANFRRANALENNDTVSLCMIGYTLAKQGKGDEAIKYYTQALKIKPGDEMAQRMLASTDLSQ